MVETLPFFSRKTTIRQCHPQKVYAMDLGLRNAVSLAHSADDGHLAESLVYHSLRRRFGENVFYWSEKDDPQVRKREVNAIEEAKKIFPSARVFIAVKTLPEKASELPCKVIPFWLLLIEDWEKF